MAVDARSSGAWLLHGSRCSRTEREDRGRDICHTFIFPFRQAGCRLFQLEDGRYRRKLFGGQWVPEPPLRDPEDHWRGRKC
jgi:hypothetical protein